MLVLFDELRNEHILIVKILNTIERLGIYTKGGQKKLLTAKRSFIAHLEKEDEEFYPALRKTAEKNNKFKRKLDHLSINMEEVTEFVLRFFDKYSSGDSGMEFKLDCERLYSILKARMLNEELLYKEYKELQH